MQGKTLIDGALCSVACCLYPNIKIAIASKTIPQGQETLNKIKEFLNDSPMLANEIADFGSGKKVDRITFKNGSTIKIYPVGDSGRGGRCHILITDEYFFVDKQKHTEVIIPFQSGKRIAGFTKKPQYQDMAEVENNKIIYTTSSVMASHWGYEEYCRFTNKMLNGESYCSFALPAQVNILNGFTTVEKLKETRLHYTTYKWATEMMAEFPDTSEDAFFDFGMLYNHQTLKAVYPQYMYNYLGVKPKLKYTPKINGEIRLLSCDIALMKGRKNDKSAYTIIRLLPIDKGYKRQIIYIESHEGVLTKKQAMRINRLYYEFDCDYIVLDSQGNALGIYDTLIDNLVDDETGENYPPLNSCNNEEMAQRCPHSDAKRVIYCIKARPEFNDTCYTALKNDFENGKIELLDTQEKGETFLSNHKDYLNLEDDKQVLFQSPYKETNDLIDELINIEVDKKVFEEQHKIKLREKSGSRKDHVSSLAYGNHIANELEREYLKKINTKRSSLLDMFMMPNQNEDWIESTYSM